MKKPLIIISGPTACGKTSLSIKLAKQINGEIISADSMQVYKYMDIGTAKPTIEEMDGVKHYLIDELYPDEKYSVAIFQQMAKKYLSKIYSKNKIPIVVGGTGFYINALVNNNDFMETNIDYSYRNYLEKLSIEKGNVYIHEILRKCDPDSANIIHPNNVKRAIRAIEFFNQTGKKISEHNIQEKSKESVYNSAFFVLNTNREQLYSRINKRIDKMIENGLVDEVNKLLKKYDEGLVSMQGLGYKEIVQHLKYNVPLDDAIETLKKNTRHFAKRQITWFKHQCNGIWIEIDDYNNIELVYQNIYKLSNKLIQE